MSSTPIKLTEFEQYLLENVAKGKGKEKWGWHSIAIRVTYDGREGETHMMDGLFRLVNYGFAVCFISSDDHANDYWEVTPAGEDYLSANKRDKS
jgi:hypothetical protein